MQNQTCLEMYYRTAKAFGEEVKYSSMNFSGFIEGTGSVSISKKTLWSEWYATCCGAVLFKENWASLSHRNLRNESGYNTKKDIESTLNELSKRAGDGKVFGFVIGGNPEHMNETLDSFNEFRIVPINGGSYFSELRKGLVVVPKTRRIILCETQEPSNKAFKKNYKILN